METFKHKRYRKETRLQAMRSELEVAKSLLERYHNVLVIYANQANWAMGSLEHKVPGSVGPELAQEVLRGHS